MGNEVLKKFSNELKLARQKKKISLDKIFNKTRIDLKYLEAIEEGNFSIMPDVYIRAFLKEYANCIDLDQDETLEKYKLAQSGKLLEEKETEVVKQETANEEAKIEDKEIPKYVSAEIEKPIRDSKVNPIKKTIIYSISFIGILVFTYLLYYSLIEETTNVKEQPFVEVLKSQEKSSNNAKIVIADNSNRESIDAENIKPKNIEKVQPNTTIVSSENKPNPKLGKLSLTIKSTSRSWIRILIDNEKTNEFIIDDNIQKNLYADEKFYLHIGNSGGITLLLNGKDLNLKGSEGRVRKISVTKDGIEYLRRRDFMSNE